MCVTLTQYTITLVALSLLMCISGVDVYPPLSVQLPSDAPIIIVNHGLTGGSHESYVRNIVRHVAKTWDQGGLGGRAAVVNVSYSCSSHCVTIRLTRVPRSFEDVPRLHSPHPISTALVPHLTLIPLLYTYLISFPMPPSLESVSPLARQ